MMKRKGRNIHPISSEINSKQLLSIADVRLNQGSPASILSVYRRLGAELLIIYMEQKGRNRPQ